MELSELRRKHSVAWLVVSTAESRRDFRTSIELMKEFLDRWGFQPCRDDFLAGIRYCEERLAELPPAPCETCGVLS